MKKIFLTILAVAVIFSLPLTAYGKTEFELGGYIRLDAMWSSQNGQSYTLANYCARDNVANADHGKFLMNANASRFNFTIKGPELWGGNVTGFMEIDFDGQPVTSTATQSVGTTVNAATGAVTTTANASQVSASSGSFNQAVLRLRHAMFKINWSEQELLFGQYWSINSELIPDTADSGAYCLYGATQLRIPQVRYTQKFGNGFDASLAIESPQNGRWGLNLDTTNQLEGETSETPMVELKGRYEQDLYGKAAWYGKPRGLYVGLGLGYFRSRNQTANFVNTTTGSTWNTFDSINYFTPGAPSTLAVNNMRYHDHWLFLIENFTPIIPTVSKNLAGTMGLAHQWWLGQGVSAWRLDLPGNDRFYRFNGLNGPTGGGGVAGAAGPSYDLSFIKRYGGWAQLQYYWTNEIFTNANFGFEKAFGFNGGQRDASLVGLGGAADPGYIYANPIANDPINMVWRIGVTQWYRPVSAVKFGLQYTYSQTNYFQRTTPNTVTTINNVTGAVTNSATSSTTNTGAAHTLFANAWYFF